MPVVRSPFGSAGAPPGSAGDHYLVGSVCPVRMAGHVCREGWIYVALVGGRWKLGYTRRGLQHRARTLHQNHHQPVDLAVGFQVQCGIGAELEVANLFGHRRLEREFFAFTPSDLAAIAALTHINGSPVQRVYLKASIAALLEDPSSQEQAP